MELLTLDAGGPGGLSQRSWYVGCQQCSAFRGALPPFLDESPPPEGDRRVLLVSFHLIFLREKRDFSYCNNYMVLTHGPSRLTRDGD